MKVNNVALLIEILIKWVSNLVTTRTGNGNIFPCMDMIILLSDFVALTQKIGFNI